MQDKLRKMRFIMRAFKQREFGVTIRALTDEMQVNMVPVAYSRMGETVTAIVDSNLTDRLTDEQIADLKKIS